MKVFTAKLLLVLVVSSGLGCGHMGFRGERVFAPSKGGTVTYTTAAMATGKSREKAMEVANDYCAPSRAIVLSEQEKREQARRKGERLKTVNLNFRCSSGERLALNQGS